MKNIFVLTAILIFQFSCDKEVYFNIPKNEKIILKDKDTIVFIDQKYNKIDSFLIRRTDDYRVSDKLYYQEEIIVKYYSLNEFTSIEEFGFGQTQSINISFGSYYFPSIFSSQKPINIDLNGVNFESVFIMKGAYFPDSIPNKVYYSNQYGIIRYDFSDGRCYELNSKIH